MANDFYSPVNFNTGSTIHAKTGYDIYVTNALANFYVGSTLCTVGANQSLNLNNPLKVTNSSITGCTTGTVYYYYYGL